MKYYDKAEIYLTSCTHPDYSNLRYLGLDTKCDINYLGSSTTLKWWIQFLGRKHFKKDVLKEIKGTMGELCKVEQRFIAEHNAVKDPNYFNMNGATRNYSVEDMVVDMHFIIRPLDLPAKDFVESCIKKMQPSLGFFSHKKRQLTSRVLCMLLYGYLKYEQTHFDYCIYSHYGGCTPSCFKDVVIALGNSQIADSVSSNIVLMDEFIENLPTNLTYELFKVQTIK